MQEMEALIGDTLCQGQVVWGGSTGSVWLHSLLTAVPLLLADASLRWSSPWAGGTNKAVVSKITGKYLEGRCIRFRVVRFY